MAHFFVDIHISENVTWGLRKKFADGKFSVGYSRFLGYDKGEDGNLAINEEQAKAVRLIFGLFIEGLTPCAIAKELTRRGILTVTGKSKWNAATINGVLANEKYTGCARIQKTFTPDFLTKKVVKNTGQVPSYFVEQSHPAIIAPETFEMVQAEVARRKREGGRYSGVSIFSGKMPVLVEMTQNCIAENARIAQDQGEYQISSEPQDFPACESLMHSKRYNGLVERYEKAKARFDEVTEAIAERSAKSERLRREASPFRGQGSSGHLRCRRSLWQSSTSGSGVRWWTM